MLVLVLVLVAVPGGMPGTARAAVPTLVDIAASVGLAETNESYHAAPADFDRDGDTDLLIGYHDQGAKLWRNDGGSFTRISPAAWPTRVDRHDCAWGDANHDGRLDAHCTVGRTGANNVKDSSHDNELWLQQADGTFVDQGTEWGIGDPYGRGRATTFLDANGDAYPDLFVGNELPRSTDPDGGANGENKLFLNNDGLGFVPAPTFGLHQFVGADCALVLDVDRDGWQDLYVCGKQQSVLYRNLAGAGFEEITATAGVATAKSRDAALGDLNGDGASDLVAVTTSAIRYQLRSGNGFAPPVTVLAATDGLEAAVGDADDDGDLDIFVLRGTDATNSADALLLNNALSFSRVDGPATGGVADAAAALDVDADGRWEFLALNGHEVRGPVQLFRLDTTDPPPPPPPPSGNLLTNGGFESDANADGRPDGWTLNNNFARSAALAHGGAFAGRWQSTKNNGPSNHQQVNVTGGARYAVDGWVNAPVTADKFTFQVKVQWRSGSSVLGTVVVRKLTDDTVGAWQQVTGSFVAPAGATSARVIQAAGSLNGTIYVDDFSFAAAP